jgi:2-polyprenyl-6-methoxyphenol hydroxylase-like FAD-dependent oxidoreductase
MADQTKPLKVLIVGSGIAGPSLAFWLHTFLPSSSITILERAPEPRLGGQAVDLRSAAIPIVERMGLLQAVKDKTTTEAGMEFVYADGKGKARFPTTGNTEQQSSKSYTFRGWLVLTSSSDFRVRNLTRRHGQTSL